MITRSGGHYSRWRRWSGWVRHPGGSSAVSAACTNRATAVVCARLGFHCKVNGTSCPEAAGRTTVSVWAAARDEMSMI
jgi:hypothetical protein